MALMIETFLMLETGNARLIAVIAYISNVRNASYDGCIFNGNYIACVSNIRNNVCVADLMTRATLLLTNISRRAQWFCWLIWYTLCRDVSLDTVTRDSQYRYIEDYRKRTDTRNPVEDW